MGPSGALSPNRNYMRGRDNASCPTLDFCPYNTYRISGDINNSSGILPDPCHKLPHPCHTAGSWIRNLNNTRPYLDPKHPLSRPGCWQTPDNLEVGRVAVPPVKGVKPVPIPGCTTKPQPCSSHPGVTFCKSDPAGGQCAKPMPHKPCPPCPPPPPPTPLTELELQQQEDAVFFSWNRAHFGGAYLSSSVEIRSRAWVFTHSLAVVSLRCRARYGVVLCGAVWWWPLMSLCGVAWRGDGC